MPKPKGLVKLAPKQKNPAEDGRRKLLDAWLKAHAPLPADDQSTLSTTIIEMGMGVTLNEACAKHGISWDGAKQRRRRALKHLGCKDVHELTERLLEFAILTSRR